MYLLRTKKNSGLGESMPSLFDTTFLHCLNQQIAIFCCAVASADGTLLFRSVIDLKDDHERYFGVAVTDFLKRLVLVFFGIT